MTTYTTKSNAIRAAKKVLGADAIPTVDFVVTEQTTDGPRGSKHTAWVWMPKAEADMWAKRDAEFVAAKAPEATAEVVEVYLSTDSEALGTYPEAEAHEKAQFLANSLNQPVFVTTSRAGGLIERVAPEAVNGAVPAFAQEPAPVKPAKAPTRSKAEPKAPSAKAVKAAAKNVAAAQAEPKEPRGPIGKTKLMIEACCRKGGATPADLRAIGGGKANPWPYVIHNPKGTGWAQRFGYEFSSAKVDGKVTYFLKPLKGGPKKAK